MTEELLKALQTIKDECTKRDDAIAFGRLNHESKCKGCPLADAYDNCAVTSDTPDTWSLKKREVYF